MHCFINKSCNTIMNNALTEIKDIQWPLGDTNFFFECCFFERDKYFSKKEEKFRISKRSCNVLFICICIYSMKHQ